MSRIKRRTRGKELVRHITRLDRENHETLLAYAQFLEEPTDYILNQLVETVLAKDKEFSDWRAQHPQSFVSPRPPQPSDKRRATFPPSRGTQSTRKTDGTSPGAVEQQRP